MTAVTQDTLTTRRGYSIWRDKAGVAGVILVLGLVILAVFSHSLAPFDPGAIDLAARLTPPFWYEGGALSHPLGTDQLGRDVLSRIIFGSRVSLVAGLSVTLVAGAFGTFVGLVSGFVGGRTDTILMRWVDMHIAFPGLLLTLVILAVIGPSLATVVIALSVNGWMVYARLVRGVVLIARELPYVEAAEVVGCRPQRIIFRHILPNLAAPILTLAVLEFARIILAEAALSFLGVGIQPPDTSWGLDVAAGRNYLFTAWWLVTFPGLAITLTVLGINFLASWLRVVADPHEGEKRFARSVMSREG